MLEARGQLLLGSGLALLAGALILGVPGAALAGSLLIAGLALSLVRLRGALQPFAAPWGVEATLVSGAGDASVAGLAGRTHRAGRPIALTLRLRVPAAFAGCAVHLRHWSATAGVELHPRLPGVLVPARGVDVPVTAVSRIAAVHRVRGVEVLLVDGLGLWSVRAFVPCPCELAVLPAARPLPLTPLGETRRRAPRMPAGERPDRVAGPGEELRELREHQPGDAFKHIAWKASARRGRLMTRVFDQERARAVFAVLDVGSTMRDGRIGARPFDQAVGLVHALAEQASRERAPFGLSLVDGREVDRVAVQEGLVALRGCDRALLDAQRIVAEDLAPVADGLLLDTVAAYLRAVERVPLPDGEGGGEAFVAYRQRTVMAAMARLPREERQAATRGPEPAARADMAILRRFCRAHALGLPYRHALPADERVAGLVRGVRVAMGARKGPFGLVVISDFRRLGGRLQPLLRTLAVAARSGHRPLVVALREARTGDVLEALDDLDDLDTARGLARADVAARRQLLDELGRGVRSAGGRMLEDPAPSRLLAAWARLGTGRRGGAQRVA